MTASWQSLRVSNRVLMSFSWNGSGIIQCLMWVVLQSWLRVDTVCGSTVASLTLQRSQMAGPTLVALSMLGCRGGKVNAEEAQTS